MKPFYFPPQSIPQKLIKLWLAGIFMTERLILHDPVKDVVRFYKNIADKIM